MQVQRGYPDGPPGQDLGVSGVTSSEDQRSSGKSCCCFSCHLCARSVSVYLEQTSWSVHILRSLPTSMVLVCIPNLQIAQKLDFMSFFFKKPPILKRKKSTRNAHCLGRGRNNKKDLNINRVRFGSRFEKIISSPANGFSSVLELPFHQSTELNDTPREHCGGECHWKPKLDIVTCIIIPSNQINLHCQIQAKPSQIFQFASQKDTRNGLHYLAMAEYFQEKTHTCIAAPSDKPESRLQVILWL